MESERLRGNGKGKEMEKRFCVEVRHGKEGDPLATYDYCLVYATDESTAMRRVGELRDWKRLPITACWEDTSNV